MKRVILFLFLFTCASLFQTFACTNTLLAAPQTTNDKIVDARAYVKQARYLIERNNYAEAKKKIEKAIELDPNNTEAKSLLNICNSKLKSPSSSQSSSSDNNTSSRKNTNTSSNRTISISKHQLTFDASGGIETITITGSSDWSISVWPEGWGHLTRNGNTLTLRVDKNPSSSSRSDSFFIKSGTKELRVSISQNGSTASPYLNLSKTSLTFPSYGGIETISISSNHLWKIKTNVESWGHITTSGNKLTIRIDSNTTSSQRSDFFVIEAGGEEKMVYIKQAGRYSKKSTNSTNSTYYPPYTNTNSSYSSYTNTYSTYRESYDGFFIIEYQFSGKATPYGLLLGGGIRQGGYWSCRFKSKLSFDTNSNKDSKDNTSNFIISGGYLFRPAEWLILNAGAGFACYDMENKERKDDYSDVGALIEAGLRFKFDLISFHIGYQHTFTDYNGSGIVLGLGFALF